jgi:simple sugar transport system permease protein
MLRSFARTQEFVVLTTIVVLSALITLVNPNFLTLGNLFDFLRFMTVDGLLALGMLVVIISAGIDVSLPAIANFTAYTVVTVLIALNFQGSIAIVFLVALPVGLALGLVNGFFIYYVRIPALIVTLGTFSLYYGAALFFVGQNMLFNLPTGMIDFSQMALITVAAPNVGTASLHPSILLLVAAAIVTWFLLKYTMIGRGIFAIGGSREVAERTGYQVNRLGLFIYGYAGVLAAVAGVTHAALYRNANPTSLRGTELDAIAAVVIGGAAITGGSGTVLGTLLGVLLLTIIRNSLILVGIPSEWQRSVVGIVLLVGVSIPAIRSTRLQRKSVSTSLE